jgi:SAM-dependent methyltransferase
MDTVKSNAEWKKWGKEDPFYAVVSWPGKQRGLAEAWTADDFFANGASDWQDFSVQWKQYGLNRESCVEVGCGAGRMTKQLAADFDRVFAVDVSEEMIDLAKSKVASANVAFSLIDGIHLPLPDGSVKGVFSTHVLQHLDSVEVGFQYFREFYRVLDMGGTLMIHLPIYEWPTGQHKLTGVYEALYKVQLLLTGFRANLKRLLGLKLMRGTPYPMRGLYDFLSGLGCSRVEFRILPRTSNGDLHAFVFATK